MYYEFILEESKNYAFFNLGGLLATHKINPLFIHLREFSSGWCGSWVPVQLCSENDSSVKERRLLMSELMKRINILRKWAVL